MNSIVCPNCQQKYAQSNPPKRLRNCMHNICHSCLSITPKCPLDNTKIDFRRYTHRGFKINDQLLKEALNSSLDDPSSFSQNSSISEGQSNSNDKAQKIASQQNKKKTISPRGSDVQQQCLLHSKPADLLCCTDGNLICSNCALFGEHKGHKIQNYQQFLSSLANVTEQALGVFDEMKQKQENVSEQIVQEYIDECYRTQRQKQVKVIKTTYSKLVQKIRKAQKAAIAKLDDEIKQKKNRLYQSTQIMELEQKKRQWYQEVEILGNVMQDAYNCKQIKSALNFLDSDKEQSYIVKRGQYLSLQFTSAQNSIKEKIDSETGSLQAKFNENMDQIIEQFCYFNTPKKIVQQQERIEPKMTSRSDVKESRPTSRAKSHVEKDSEDDILLDPQENSQVKNYGYELSNASISPINQKFDAQSRMMRVNEVPITHSIQPYFQKDAQIVLEQSNNLARSRGRSRCDSTHNTSSANYSTFQPRKYNMGASNINILAPSTQDNTNKKKSSKKIEIPQKYRSILQDLKHDRSQVIDFNGAQLGDQNVAGLIQHIEKSKKLRNLKLVRNKLTDDCIQDILSACYMGKVTSLNLGQNSLTQKTLQILESYDLGDLRNITLSLNKINRRNVKSRLEQFSKRGITVSI